MDTKQLEILQGAFAMFDKIGIRSVSIDDIAQELHISKKTFYLHFKNKEDLIIAFLDAHLEEDFRIYHEAKNNTTYNAIDILLHVSKNVCTHLRTTNHSHMFELQKYYPVQFKYFWDTKRKTIIEYITNNLEEGISQGLYRNEIIIALEAELFSHSLEGFRESLNESFFERFSFEQVMYTIFEKHLRSIANKKGLTYLETYLENNNTL